MATAISLPMRMSMLVVILRRYINKPLHAAHWPAAVGGYDW